MNDFSKIDAQDEISRLAQVRSDETWELPVGTQCDSNDLGDHGGYVQCTNAATETLWCPTWVTADKGPMNLCEHHARNFKPEFNQYAQNGEWHWGADAHKAFAASRKSA